MINFDSGTWGDRVADAEDLRPYTLPVDAAKETRYMEFTRERYQ